MRVKISKDLNSIESLVKEIKFGRDEIGAITIFEGIVRGSGQNEKVIRLEYQSYRKIALNVMRTIIDDVNKKYGIIDAIIQHRIGIVHVGEEIMHIVVASKHRREGLEAIHEIVERIKNEVPIWKKEVTTKGSYWIENP